MRTPASLSPPISASANERFAGGLGPVAARRFTFYDFYDAKMITARRDRPTQHRHILKTGNNSFRCKARSEATRRKK